MSAFLFGIQKVTPYSVHFDVIRAGNSLNSFVTTALSNYLDD